MNFSETLLHPDKEELENPESRVIVNASNILQVGEFQLLQLAYRDWHGEDLPEDHMDQLFKSYMIDGIAPPWARHYARKIVAEDNAGDLDYNQRRYHRFDCDYRVNMRLDASSIAFALCFMAMMIGGGMVISTFEADPTTSMFPPYLSDLEIEPQSKI